MLAASLALGSPTLIGGCSFMAVRAPQKDDRGRLEPAGCTTTKAAPLADGIITGAVLGSAILATVASAQDTNPAAPQSSGNDVLLAGGVIAALFAISGIYGAVTVNNYYNLDRINTFSLRRKIAKHVIEAGGYAL